MENEYPKILTTMLRACFQKHKRSLAASESTTCAYCGVKFVDASQNIAEEEKKRLKHIDHIIELQLFRDPCKPMLKGLGSIQLMNLTEIANNACNLQVSKALV